MLKLLETSSYSFMILFHVKLKLHDFEIPVMIYIASRSRAYSYQVYI